MKRVIFMISAVLLLCSMWTAPASALIRPVEPPPILEPTNPPDKPVDPLPSESPDDFPGVSTPPNDLDNPPVVLPPSEEEGDHPIASMPPGELDEPPVALPPSGEGDDHPIAPTPPGELDGPPVALPPLEKPDSPSDETEPHKRPDLLFVSTSLDYTVVNFRLTDFDGTTSLKLQFSLDGELDWTEWPVALKIDPPYLRSDNIIEEEITMYLRLAYEDGAVSEPFQVPMRPRPQPNPAPVPTPEDDPSEGDFDGGDREPQHTPSAPIEPTEDLTENLTEDSIEAPPEDSAEDSVEAPLEDSAEDSVEAPLEDALEDTLPPFPLFGSSSVYVGEPDYPIDQGSQTSENITGKQSQGLSPDTQAPHDLPSSSEAAQSNLFSETQSEEITVTTGSVLPHEEATPVDADTDTAKDDSVLVPILILTGIFACVLFVHHYFWRRNK